MLQKNSWQLKDNPLEKIVASGLSFVPWEGNVFAMFDLLSPEEVRVVIIGQDPYPGYCETTKVYYACGPAFLVADEVRTCPPTLQNLFKEYKRDFAWSFRKRITNLKEIKDKVKSWMYQGVFLTNVALTRGVEGTYLDDHKVLWMNFTINFLEKVSSLGCPVVLLGKEAWSLERYVTHTKVLKLHHPASRNNEFIGCGMFSKVNEMLEIPIQW